MTPLKKVFLFFISFTILICVIPQWADQPVKNKFFRLENGLKVYLEERDKLPLVNIGFGIDMGSKNETSETNGMVHLLEHLMLLGGTHDFTDKQIEKQIREKALYFNAHTSHDVMTLDVSAPSEYTDFALKLVHQKVFHLNPTQEAMEREKKAILEEISQTQDDPEKLGLFLTLKHIFNDHPYSRPVTGTKEVIENATLDTVKSFYKTYCFPSNCSLCLVGDFKIEEIEKKIKAVFGVPQDNGNSKELSSSISSISPIPPVSPLKKTTNIKRELDISRAHLFFGFIAPGMNHEERIPMNVLTRIFSKGVTPLLYSVLRGKRRIAEGISMRYIYLKYGGVVVIHLVLEPKRMKTARNELLKFLKKSKTFRYSKSDYIQGRDAFVMDYLETAKNSMQLSSQEFKEEGLNLALAYAAYFLTNNGATDDEAEQNKENNNEKDPRSSVETVTSDHIRKAASNYLAGKKYVMVSIVPQKK